MTYHEGKGLSDVPRHTLFVDPAHQHNLCVDNGAAFHIALT